MAPWILFARGWLFGLILALAATMMAPASAFAIVIDATDRGWWSNDNRSNNSSGPANTFTGTDFFTYRAYFVFDLGGFGGGAVSGTLDLEIEDYVGPDPSEPFDVRDYTGSIATLTTALSDPAPYPDLGDGAQYGSGSVTPADVGSVISIPLTASALADINAAAGGLFALGLDATSLSTLNEGFRVSAGTEARIHQLNLIVSSVLGIEIDIRPGNDVNPVNPRSHGVIPVAILGSESFDVDDVDVTTLAFGPAAAPVAHRHGPHRGDVNHDGIPDLLAHFRTQETGITPGDTQACLTGALIDGTPLEGCDAVRTVPSH